MLVWPSNVKRVSGWSRETNRKFRTSVIEAKANVHDALYRFSEESGKKLSHVRITYAPDHEARREPACAVWFQWDGVDLCFAIDKYDNQGANLQAIFYVIQAHRNILRYGNIAMVRQAFTGFEALPPPPSQRSWQDIFGFTHRKNITIEDVKATYRTLVKKHHPDQGGDHDFMAALNAARDKALRELGA